MPQKSRKKELPLVNAGEQIFLNAPLLTVKDLAAYLNLDVTTIYKMVDRGEIPVVRLGTNRRTVRFKKEALLAWIKESETGQTTRLQK